MYDRESRQEFQRQELIGHEDSIDFGGIVVFLFTDVMICFVHEVSMRIKGGEIIFNK